MAKIAKSTVYNVTDDQGTVHSFTSQQEAQEFIRKPKVLKALNELTKNNDVLTDWLYKNQEGIKTLYQSTQVRRVTKSERKALSDALDAVVAIANSDPRFSTAFSFLVTHADAIKQTFRWPTVTRMSKEDAEKQLYINAADFAGSDMQGKWLIDNKDALLAAFGAGVEKRAVAPVAQAALAAYRQKQQERKAQIDACGDDEAAKANLRAKFKAEDDAARAAKEAK